MNNYYFKKYLKYKTKYIELKRLYGGADASTNTLPKKLFYIWLPFPSNANNVGAINRTALIAGTQLIVGSNFFNPIPNGNVKIQNMNQFLKRADFIGQRNPIYLVDTHDWEKHKNNNKIIDSSDLYQAWKTSQNYHFIFLNPAETNNIRNQNGEDYPLENLFKIKFNLPKNYIFVFGNEINGFSILDDPDIFFKWFLDTFPRATYSFAYIPKSTNEPIIINRRPIYNKYIFTPAVNMTMSIVGESNQFNTTLKYPINP